MLQKTTFTNYFHFCIKKFFRRIAPLPISIFKFWLFFFQFAHEYQLFRFPDIKSSSFSHIFDFCFTNFHHFEPKSVASRPQIITLPIIPVFWVSPKLTKMDQKSPLYQLFVLTNYTYKDGMFFFFFFYKIKLKFYIQKKLQFYTDKLS